MAELRERLRNGRFREHSMGLFGVLVDEGLCSAAEARRARWSAHRAEYGSQYLILSSVILASFAYRLVEPLPPEGRSATMPFVMGPSVLLVVYVFAGAWGARFAGSRIHRQVAKLLDELGDVDALASGRSRCRLGNPARLEQMRIRTLRALLRRAAVTVPRELLLLSGRGHQSGDLVTTDKVMNVFLDALIAVPRPESVAERKEFRGFLATLSVAVMEADPYSRLERAVRAVPAACSARSAPLKTWRWQLSSLSIPVLLSIIAVPVAGFLIIKFAGSSTPTGLVVAAVATAFQAAMRYLKNHRD
ncbi:hypothetical protein H4696_003355 [Amycolatopsis lexingtonensis]|uniref:Uncharacterized protein n=1 Tax=Amycolatopsis lexingtonensis TaxID=218822 RepID=A0ABR9HZ95_9PSEU|nr:hypothetical protein [Amycolatopsis lexingtonensis]MBE1496255.1 hypothetical protein [Amycolatopsis lexingtonensis]